VLAVPLHLALLYPASRTPKSTGTAMAGGGELSEQQVLDYFARLTPAEAQATADARAEWLAATVPDFPVPAARQRFGPADAPMKIVEFTDVLCGHCRTLVAMLNELKKATPKGRISIEPRYFPLDGECNPHAGPPRGDGVRCLGAKVQLCLEGHPEYWDVRDALFENQSTLSQEKIWQLAGEKGGLSRAELEACVKSPATVEKLQTDIAWAMAYGIEGTPLVLVNGKVSSGMGPFLFGMAMSGGDPSSKFFAKLPAAR
jgi:protein-disulfide isomerase